MTDVGKLTAELGKANPEFAAAAAEVELIRKTGDMLEQMRERAKLTQEELAKRLGISASRVSQLESGTLRDAPSLKMLARFARECGQSVDIAPAAPQPEREKSSSLLDAIAQGFAALGGKATQHLVEQLAKQIAELRKQVAELTGQVAELKEPDRTYATYGTYGTIGSGMVGMAKQPAGYIRLGSARTLKSCYALDSLTENALAEVEHATKGVLADAGLHIVDVCVAPAVAGGDQFQLMFTVKSG